VIDKPEVIFDHRQQMLGMRAYALRIRAEFHKSVPQINSKERAAFSAGMRQASQDPESSHLFDGRSSLSKTYVTKDYRIRSLLSITLHISRPGESVRGPIIKPD
jgi:hypothetical protein